MTLLYGAASEGQVQEIRGFLKDLADFLDSEDHRNKCVRFDNGIAFVFTNIIDIGTFPNEINISKKVRESMFVSGFAQLTMKDQEAKKVAFLIRNGMARHENGVFRPEDFIVH